MDDRPSKRAVGRDRRWMVSYDETPRRTKKRRDREHTQTGERGRGEEAPRTQQRYKKRKADMPKFPDGLPKKKKDLHFSSNVSGKRLSLNKDLPGDIFIANENSRQNLLSP